MNPAGSVQLGIGPHEAGMALLIPRSSGRIYRSRLAPLPTNSSHLRGSRRLEFVETEPTMTSRRDWAGREAGMVSHHRNCDSVVGALAEREHRERRL